MEHLLTNSWDNTLLFGPFMEALQDARASNIKDTSLLLRETSVYLFDNPKMGSWTEDVMVVEKDLNHRFVLFSKEHLIKELEKTEIAEVSDVTLAMKNLIDAVALKILKNEKMLTVSGGNFKNWLDTNGLSNVANQMGLSEKSSMKMK